MKMMKWFFVATAIAVVVALAGCATARVDPDDMPPPPAGTERVLLANAAYVIYRFDLPEGAVWGDFSHITVDYMLDERSMRLGIRHWRLMGVYREEHFGLVSERFGWRAVPLGDQYVNDFGTGTWNGPFIMHNNMGTPDWGSLGAVADEWFTVRYDISGAAAHAQFDRANALPAADDPGPFFVGVGISGDDMFHGIQQYIRNVTLHHRTNPALSVVSLGSGFAEPTFAGWTCCAMFSWRVAGPPLPAGEPVVVEEYAAYEYAPEVAYYY